MKQLEETKLYGFYFEKAENNLKLEAWKKC